MFVRPPLKERPLTFTWRLDDSGNRGGALTTAAGELWGSNPRTNSRGGISGLQCITCVSNLLYFSCRRG